MRRALAGAPVVPFLPLGFCGQKPHWAPRWGGASCQCKASREQYLEKRGQKNKFFRRQKFAPLLKEYKNQ